MNIENGSLYIQNKKLFFFVVVVEKETIKLIIIIKQSSFIIPNDFNILGKNSF